MDKRYGKNNMYRNKNECQVLKKVLFGYYFPLFLHLSLIFIVFIERKECFFLGFFYNVYILQRKKMIKIDKHLIKYDKRIYGYMICFEHTL